MSDDTLAHYGTPFHSGRYPWGSGGDPYQGAKGFAGAAADLRKQGLSETQIAGYFGMKSTTELRARQAAAKNYITQEETAQCRRLREKGMSVGAIAERTGLPKSTVLNRLKVDSDIKANKTEAARETLKKQVEEHTYIDISKGTDQLLNCSSTQLNTAVQMLKDEGYSTEEMFTRQLGLADSTVTSKVLMPPGYSRADLMANRGKVRIPFIQVDEEGGFGGNLRPPASISSKRVKVVFGDEGGSEMDGVIELRRGVKELDLGASHYAQGRILIDGTHFAKGMMLYADDLPDGIDIRVQTNKHSSKGKMGALKTVAEDGDPDNPTNPFKAAIKRQSTYSDGRGRTQIGAINIINEEGDWDRWSRSLASQYLGKQRNSEAKRQLDVTHNRAQKEYDDIMKLTNPVVRQKLLESYADSCDAKAVNLKAAAYSRQAAQVILPLKSIKPNEIYAPNFKHGERVALVRYPHGGTFEIPELTVNNKSRVGISVMGNKALDAVGIHSSVADRLSGADFDGDTVVVIPNNSGRVKSTPALDGLKGYDPKDRYPSRPGMKVLNEGKQTQTEMGTISNLITDMQVKGASTDEVARAVRHSMTVIDAAKHKLDYKQSELDNDIATLRRKYQSKPDGHIGASTLLSQSNKKVTVNKRKLRTAKDGGKYDPKTGKKVWVETGESYISKSGKKVYKKSKARVGELVDDAHSLSTGRAIEHIYADHSNRMRSLANQARKSAMATKPTPYSPNARKKYKTEVVSLREKLKKAYLNKPYERQAQILANARSQLIFSDNPNMDDDSKRKTERRALAEARASVGADKYKINITSSEWEAIQEGAISTNMLREIVENAEPDHIRSLAMPNSTPALTSSQTARAKAMLKTHTTSEVADALGVSASTVRDYVRGDNE